MIRIAASVCLFALAVLFAVSAHIAWRLPDQVDAAIAREAALTREAALEAVAREGERLDLRLASLEKQAAREIRKTRELADDRLSVILLLADLHLAATRKDLNAHLLIMNHTLATAASEASTLVPPARNILEVASENADLLGQCAIQDPVTGQWAGNPDCFANRAIPALRAMEKVGESSERIAESVETITAEGARVAPAVAESTKRAAEGTASFISVLTAPFRALARLFR